MTDPLAVTEFRQAVAALVAAGFTNGRAIEVLTCRKHLRDEYTQAALTGLLSAYGNDREALTLVKMAFRYADECLVQRRPG